MINHESDEEFYNWLINPEDNVKLIDFENIENNDFRVVCELPLKIMKQESTSDQILTYYSMECL